MRFRGESDGVADPGLDALRDEGPDPTNDTGVYTAEETEEQKEELSLLRLRSKGGNFSAHADRDRCERGYSSSFDIEEAECATVRNPTDSYMGN